MGAWVQVPQFLDDWIGCRSSARYTFCIIVWKPFSRYCRRFSTSWNQRRSNIGEAPLLADQVHWLYYPR